MSDSPNPEQEQEYQAQLAQQMRRYAEKARSIINDNYEVVLTYNASGLQWIDGYLQHKFETQDSTHLAEISLYFGAFLGECIIAANEARWAGIRPDYYIEFDTGNRAYPGDAVYALMSKGDKQAQTLSDYFKMIWQIRFKETECDLAELSKTMSRCADAMVEWIRQSYQYQLGYDEAGVKVADQLLTEFYKHPASQPSNIVLLFSAYLGECVIRETGGRWAKSGEHIMICFTNGNYAFPFTKVRKHLHIGPEESIASFFKAQKFFAPSILPPHKIRLLDIYENHPHSSLYIGKAMEDGPKWIKVIGVSDEKLEIPSSEYGLSADQARISIFLKTLERFYISSAEGQLLLQEGITEEYAACMPAQIRQQLSIQDIQRNWIGSDELKSGQAYAELWFAPSPEPGKHENGFATYFKNISKQRLRVRRFGGFRLKDNRWTLANHTNAYFTESEFRAWYKQGATWLEPGQQVCDDSNWGGTPALWAYFCENEQGQKFTVGKVLHSLDFNQSQPPTIPELSRLGRKSGHYFTKSQPAQKEFGSMLMDLRLEFMRQAKRLSQERLRRYIARAPNWLNNQDALIETVRKQQLLLTQGRIYWGALVMANRLLFSEGEGDSPAMLVYSDDVYFDDRPHELRAIASQLGRLKNQVPDDPEERQAADLVSDEMNRSMKVRLPACLSEKQVWGGAFMVFRQHLAGRVLTNNVFPILAHPETEAVMIVPHDFWPIALLGRWQQAELNF